MGVKTTLTLTELQKLFPKYTFKTITPTKDGVMDTTYIVKNSKNEYILKKYERSIETKILFDAELLKELKRDGLNVPLLLTHNKEWYLYTKLKGTLPNTPSLKQITALGRFLAQFHTFTQKIKEQNNFIENYPLSILLQETKAKHYLYYKKLSSLTRYKQECDGFIHGDIFKDNTLFDGNKVAIFDFIDGGCGSFAFDLGVILLSFNPHKRRSYTMMLLKSYNQTAPKKIKLQELKKKIQIAAKLYALLRIHNHKKTQKAKELLSFIQT